LGSIDDLRYFSNKLARGLRVPSSYLPTGPDEQTGAHADGRVGTALIQEYRFNQYCERLQSLVAAKLDDEFKMFLRWRGFNIDSGLFDITLTPPQNFATYRQAEVDQVRVNVFQSIEGLPYMSKRFSLERFLGLTKEEIMENEKLWREERDTEKEGAGAPEGSDLRAVGVMPRDMTSDMDMGDEFASMSPEDIVAPEAPEAPETVSPEGEQNI